jgi:hypothetical protein
MVVGKWYRLPEEISVRQRTRWILGLCAGRLESIRRSVSQTRSAGTAGRTAHRSTNRSIAVATLAGRHREPNLNG